MKLPVTKTSIQARFPDTDALGHISNEAFVTYMAVGRMAFFEEIRKLTGYNASTVVANLNIDYLRELFYQDEIEVVTWCEHVGNTSMKVCNDIYANSELAAKGYTISVTINLDTKRPVLLPQEWEVSERNPVTD